MMVFPAAIGLSAFLHTLVACLIAALPVRLTTSDGETIEGNLGGFTEKALSLERDGDSVKYAYDRLVTLSPVELDEKTGPVFSVLLLSGSRIAAEEVSLADDQLVIKPRRQEPLKLNVKAVKSIRFRPGAPKTNPLWLGLLEKQGRGDTLAIRREGERLDPYGGVVKSIDATNVSFDLDSTPIQAPIEKLEGLVFGGNRPVTEDADVRVVDVYGSVWSAIKILASKEGEPLRLQLDTDLEHSIPLSQIETIRWNSGLRMLASGAAAADSFQSHFDSKVDKELLRKWFGPRPEGDTDLIMRGNSWVEYRVEPGFTKLAGGVQRSESVEKAGAVKVKILIDNQVRWEEDIDDSDRLGFELVVNNGRRVRIEVVSGDDGDLGDTVRISRPRLVK